WPETDYTTLSLSEVRAGLQDLVRDTRATFGGLDVRQLNWRPDAVRWSVAQCFEHLLMANHLMVQAAEDALGRARPTGWQRVPFLPGLFGRTLIRSRAPEAVRKFTTSSGAQPALSAIGADVIQRFIEQDRDRLHGWRRSTNVARPAPS